MALELYFYNECGFSQSVLNCMSNLHCEDKIIKKNIPLEELAVLLEKELR